MKTLEGMSILVTGGGSGIGLGTARYCVERGANVTICLLLSLAMQTFTNAMVAIRTELEGFGLYIVDAIYWIVPHLQLFDLSKKEVHNWPAVPLWVLAALTIYALIYSSFFIVLGSRRFSKLSL